MVITDNAGHNPLSEQPNEVMDAIREFVAPALAAARRQLGRPS